MCILGRALARSPTLNTKCDTGVETEEKTRKLSQLLMIESLGTFCNELAESVG